jgi:hypothetical protein
MKKWDGFRSWVHQLWILNCEEHSMFNIPKDDVQVYFNKHKWWLKREYRKQR